MTARDRRCKCEAFLPPSPGETQRGKARVLYELLAEQPNQQLHFDSCSYVAASPAADSLWRIPATPVLPSKLLSPPRGAKILFLCAA